MIRVQTVRYFIRAAVVCWYGRFDWLGGNDKLCNFRKYEQTVQLKKKEKVTTAVQRYSSTGIVQSKKYCGADNLVSYILFEDCLNTA